MKYEIWTEGWTMDDGSETDATFVGTIEAESFEEACIKLAESNINQEFSKNFNREKMTYWSGRLFDNKEDAINYTNKKTAKQMRFFHGCFNGLLLAIPFWLIVLLLWMSIK